MKLRCIKSATSLFTVGKEYEVLKKSDEVSNVKTIYIVKNNSSGSVGGVILNGSLWSFEIVKDNKGMKELNFIEAMTNVKNNDEFEVVSEPLDRFNEVITLKVEYINGGLIINPTNTPLSSTYTLEAISKMKFYKLEKKLTLDDFKIGEIFKVEDRAGIFIKTVIVDEMVIINKIDNKFSIVLEEYLEDRQLIKLEERE